MFLSGGFDRTNIQNLLATCVINATHHERDDAKNDEHHAYELHSSLLRPSSVHAARQRCRVGAGGVPGTTPAPIIPGVRSWSVRARAPRGDLTTPPLVSDPDILAAHLEDAAHFPGGHASGLVVPA